MSDANDLDRIAEHLRAQAAVFAKWCRLAAPIMREHSERALTEGHPWVQERLSQFLDRLDHARDQLERLEGDLATRPVTWIAGQARPGLEGVWRRLLADETEPAAGLLQVLDNGGLGTTVRIRHGGLNGVQIHLRSTRTGTDAVNDVALPDQLELPDPTAVAEWVRLLGVDSDDYQVGHDTRIIHHVGAGGAGESDGASDHLPLHDLHQRLDGADVGAGDPAVGDPVDLLLVPPLDHPPAGRAEETARLHRQAAEDSDLMVLVSAAEADEIESGFLATVWEPWCRRCGAEDDSRGLDGRFLLVITGANRLFASTDRAPGPWLHEDQQQLLLALQGQVCNRLPGLHDRGPAAWPAVVFVDEQAPRFTIASGEREQVLAALLDRFHEQGGHVIDADAAWPESWRAAWRAAQGLWSLARFRHEAGSRSRVFRRLLQAVLAFMDPGDGGIHRLRRLVGRWAAAGPARVARLDVAASRLDTVLQDLHELAHEMRPRDLHDYDPEQVRRAAAILTRSGAYDPLDLGFRFGARDCPGLGRLRASILAQETVRLPAVLAAVVEDTVARMPFADGDATAETPSAAVGVSQVEPTAAAPGGDGAASDETPGTDEVVASEANADHVVDAEDPAPSAPAHVIDATAASDARKREATDRAELAQTLCRLIELDAAWRSFRDHYIGPKDLDRATLAEAAHVAWRRIDAVLEWLVELEERQPESELQSGESPAAALDRLLRTAPAPDLPTADLAEIDRAIQDHLLGAALIADEE